MELVWALFCWGRLLYFPKQKLYLSAVLPLHLLHLPPPCFWGCSDSLASCQLPWLQNVFISASFQCSPSALGDDTADKCTGSRGVSCVAWYIRRKALLSSVGFRKPMTSRSPRGSLCDLCQLRFDRPLWFVWWADVCFEVLSCFFDHPSIDSTKKMPLHLFGKDVLMFRLDQAS